MHSDQVPSVTTKEITGISTTEAICGGEITNNGGLPITSAGVCWSESPVPTVSDFSTSDVIDNEGAFSSKVSALKGETTYYLRAYAENSLGIGYGSVVTFRTLYEQSEVLDEFVAYLTDTEATLNGRIKITDQASAQVSFEYGTTPGYGFEVEVSKNQVTDEHVSVSVFDLQPGTTYYYRIKVADASGTIFGMEETFNTSIRDVEGTLYRVVKIGNQMWMQENLRTTRYANGDLIGTTTDLSQDLTESITPHYEWPCTVPEFGRYYTYYAITDERDICPEGWHVPSDEEWTELTDYLSDHGYGFDGNPKKISKSLAAPSGWIDDLGPGSIGNDMPSNNRSGFTGVASGGRYSNGIVEFSGQHGIWWSSTESSESSAFFRCIGYVLGEVYRGKFDQAFGLPVRCVKDQ